jgi:hypothetical protein
VKKTLLAAGLLLALSVSLYYFLGVILTLITGAEFIGLAVSMFAVGVLFLLLCLLMRRIARAPLKQMVRFAVMAAVASVLVELWAASAAQREGPFQSIDFERSRLACTQSSCEMISTDASSSANTRGKIYTFRVVSIEPSRCEYFSIARLAVGSIEDAPIEYGKYRNAMVISRTHLLRWFFDWMYGSRSIYEVANC